MYVLIHWAPYQSSIKQRMIYPSSRMSLKGYLGIALFNSSDYCINIKDECNSKKFIDQQTMTLSYYDNNEMNSNYNNNNDRIEFKNELQFSGDFNNTSTLFMPTKISHSIIVTQTLPMEMITDNNTLVESIEKYRKNESKVIVLKLSEDKKNIISEEQKEETVSFIRDLLPDNEPRYLMFWHTRVRKDEKIPKAPTVRVFGFYCPENCERSLKFAYSTIKCYLLNYCSQISLVFDGKVEITDKPDFTHEFLDYNVFPITDDKVTFDKPKPASRKKKKQQRNKLNT